MNNYDFEKHLEKARKVYEHKCNLMLECMKKEFHPSVTFGHPEGGLFVMAFLPEGMDSAPFVKEAIKRGVLSVPGAAFLADENQKSNGFRLISAGLAVAAFVFKSKTLSYQGNLLSGEVLCRICQAQQRSECDV